MVNFLRELYSMQKNEKPTNKMKCWLSRCSRAYSRMKADGLTVADFYDHGKNGRKRKSTGASQCPARRLTFFRGSRGPVTKCPVLGMALWDWFVDIRSSVLTSMSPKYLLMKAKAMADTIVAEMAKEGEFIDMPVIDMRWVRRWRHEHGVVLLQPNRRYKVSWAMAAERCKYMWKNNFRVRYMAQIYLGNDLRHRIFGIDEKPIHFNESASKAVKTLHFEGAPYCALRTNHSASRDRLSLMTMVTSWRDLCKCAMKPPVALCVRAQSAQKLASVVLPAEWPIPTISLLSLGPRKGRSYIFTSIVVATEWPIPAFSLLSWCPRNGRSP